MPGNTGCYRPQARQALGFNEAPAGCRGIPADTTLRFQRAVQASMRPRLDAGEYG